MDSKQEKDSQNRRAHAAGPPPDASPALELIAAVYRRISSIRRRGKTPTGVVLPMSLYTALQEYRAGLGEVPDGLPDYLGKHELFGLPIYTDTVNNPQVLVQREKPRDER